MFWQFACLLFLSYLFTTGFFFFGAFRSGRKSVFWRRFSIRCFMSLALWEGQERERESCLCFQTKEKSLTVKEILKKQAMNTITFLRWLEKENVTIIENQMDSFATMHLSCLTCVHAYTQTNKKTILIRFLCVIFSMYLIFWSFQLLKMFIIVVHLSKWSYSLC